MEALTRGKDDSVLVQRKGEGGEKGEPVSCWKMYITHLSGPVPDPPLSPHMPSRLPLMSPLNLPNKRGPHTHSHIGSSLPLLPHTLASFPTPTAAFLLHTVHFLCVSHLALRISAELLERTRVVVWALAATMCKASGREPQSRRAAEPPSRRAIKSAVKCFCFAACTDRNAASLTEERLAGPTPSYPVRD